MKKIERQSRIRCTVGAVEKNEEEENNESTYNKDDNQSTSIGKIPRKRKVNNGNRGKPSKTKH